MTELVRCPEWNKCKYDCPHKATHTAREHRSWGLTYSNSSCPACVPVAQPNATTETQNGTNGTGTDHIADTSKMVSTTELPEELPQIFAHFKAFFRDMEMEALSESFEEIITLYAKAIQQRDEAREALEKQKKLLIRTTTEWGIRTAELQARIAELEAINEQHRQLNGELRTEADKLHDEIYGLEQVNSGLLNKIAELERYDIRQHIPDGKHCHGCRFTRYYYCALVRYFLPKDSSGDVMKHKDCPKPYEEKE